MPKRIKYTKEMLTPIIQNSKSISDVLRHLGLVLRGGNFATIKRKIQEFNIDTNHFIGQGWSKGLTNETSQIVNSISNKKTKHNINTVSNTQTRLGSNSLNRIMKEAKIPYQCSICDISTWQEKPITLQKDHIDGNYLNNNISNLRYLCPNCHSQTPTFGAKNGAARGSRTPT